MEHLERTQAYLAEKAPGQDFAYSLLTVPGPAGAETMVAVQSADVSFCIRSSATWPQIQRIADKKLSWSQSTAQPECEICRNKVQKALLNCNACGNDMCGSCYLELFRAGQGFVTCPHCRYTFGARFPPTEVERHLCNMRTKLGL